MKITCREISSIFSKLNPEKFVEEASILLPFIEERCIGRKALITKTGFSERKVRGIVDSLINRGILTKNNETCVDNGIYASLKEVKITRWELNGNYVVNTLCCFEPQFLELLSRFIVQLRDSIVIDLKDPWAFEVIGIYYRGNLILPGVPNEAALQYIDLLKGPFLDGSIVILWRRFKKYLCEATVLHGLMKICLNIYW